MMDIAGEYFITVSILWNGVKLVVSSIVSDFLSRMFDL